MDYLRGRSRTPSRWVWLWAGSTAGRALGAETSEEPVRERCPVSCAVTCPVYLVFPVELEVWVFEAERVSGLGEVLFWVSQGYHRIGFSLEA